MCRQTGAPTDRIRLLDASVLHMSWRPNRTQEGGTKRPQDAPESATTGTHQMGGAYSSESRQGHNSLRKGAGSHALPIYWGPTRQVRGRTPAEHPHRGGKDLRIVRSKNAGTRRRQCGARRHLDGQPTYPLKPRGSTASPIHVHAASVTHTAYRSMPRLGRAACHS